MLIVKTDVFDDVHEADEELDAYTRSVINQVKKLSEINPYFNEEMKLAMTELTASIFTDDFTDLLEKNVTAKRMINAAADIAPILIIFAEIFMVHLPLKIF